MPTPEIEDTATRNARNAPSFLRVVLLAGAAILLILLGTFFVFHKEAKRLVPNPDSNTQPQALLYMPFTGHRS